VPLAGLAPDPVVAMEVRYFEDDER
jgi:hypothetical protein